jgi:asparagine synthase (glutamine-hydrolysing)
MRTRFVALAGSRSALARACAERAWPAQLPPGWSVLFEAGGLLVVGNHGTPTITLPRGVVVGRLFDGSTGAPVLGTDDRFARAVDDTKGRHLIERHWGSYCAILHDDLGGHWILRDPSASLPVYATEADGLHCYFSDLATALELRVVVGRDLDAIFLSQWLTFPFLRAERTGLSAVKELLPGTLRRVREGRVDTVSLWSPWTFADRGHQLDDFAGAAARLREVALQTIASQAAGCGSMVLELSGGLDSSIIAAAFKAADLPFISVNFATRSADGDERGFARAVAEATGARHFEVLEQRASVDLALPDRQRLRPGLSAVMAPLHRDLAAFGEAAGGETFVTGAGGDNVFCYLTTAAPVVDAARQRGLAFAARTALQDVSELCGCTTWTTARFALRKGLRGRNAPAWKAETDFLRADAVADAPDPHPWLQPPPGAVPGKREHIAALMRIHHNLDPETRLSDRPFLHPLMAQPLVELCLGIPTWLWVHGGQNRAVARAAFNGLLPREILSRRSKGRLESMCLRAYLAHRMDLAELLLGGQLRQDGLIDADALEAYLERENAPADARYYRIFELASAELWARSWRG